MGKRPVDRLAKYRSKRDFRATPEPAGTPAGRKRARKPSERKFCVQKHLARSLHYDLRLEHNGVLLSWAVPKGPSLSPRDRRFAARTEDHPIEYGDFEGVIPEGYGAGVVLLWDTGTWTPEVPDIDAALEQGELKFSIDGVKLKGSWVLVRTAAGRPAAQDGRSNEPKEQWLLIKHRDGWSGDLDVTEFAPQSVKSFGDLPDVVRAAGIPPAWRRRLPVQSGETAALLRSVVAAAARAPDEHAGASAAVASKRAAKFPAAALRLGKNRPKFSNLDKVLYPSGFTKGQVIDYYARVAPLILPHLAGRAATLLRYPDGVEGEAFFQKRCPDHRPPWVKTVIVPSADSADDDDPIDYCVIGDLATLLWVANLAAVELHVPLAMGDAPDVPTAMVLDLDPGPPAGLPECFAVARRARDLLAGIGLRSFAKLSGKKGVHMLVPLNVPGVTFDQTKRFAKAVARTLARDDPQRITDVMRKDLRPGKVFVDWNQNDRAKTNACAYSLRAAPRPAASWPVDIDAKPEAIFADDLTLPRTDPLAGLLTLRQRLPDGL